MHADRHKHSPDAAIITFNVFTGDKRRKCTHAIMHAACDVLSCPERVGPPENSAGLLRRGNLAQTGRMLHASVLQDNVCLLGMRRCCDALSVRLPAPGMSCVGRREMMEEEEAGHSPICVSASQHPAAARSPACSQRPAAIPSAALSGAGLEAIR